MDHKIPRTAALAVMLIALAFAPATQADDKMAVVATSVYGEVCLTFDFSKTVDPAVFASGDLDLEAFTEAVVGTGVLVDADGAPLVDADVDRLIALLSDLEASSSSRTIIEDEDLDIISLVACQPAQGSYHRNAWGYGVAGPHLGGKTDDGTSLADSSLRVTDEFSGGEWTSDDTVGTWYESDGWGAGTLALAGVPLPSSNVGGSAVHGTDVLEVCRYGKMVAEQMAEAGVDVNPQGPARYWGTISMHIHDAPFLLPLVDADFCGVGPIATAYIGDAAE